MRKNLQRSFLPTLVLLSGVPFARAQATKPELPIQIVQPAVDTANGEVTLPGAFWNQHMISWVEVALCGRPSDFLHETIVSVTTTKTLLMQALRDVGCHDADAWAKGVADFPGIRGDRLMIILEVTRGGKVEKYSLDELLQYMGWGVSAGPYGWMFKGDPERNMGAATMPGKVNAAAVGGGDGSDASKIVHDDPQVAIVYKGIQHSSQSFADHPLSYDEWIYPMMRYARNDKVLPTAVFDSNGDVPVKVILKKVSEEGLITESAKAWHDAAFSKYMREQVPTAKAIDEEKGELWKMLAARATTTQDSVASDRAGVLRAEIAAGYAKLDAAWANWSCDHTAFESDDAKEIEALEREVAMWKAHMTLRAMRAGELAVAVKAAADQSVLEGRGTAAELQRLRGVEIEARSMGALAENQQAIVYWKEQQVHLDRQGDPRADWIRHVDGEVKLCNARGAAGVAGQSYGAALQGKETGKWVELQKTYAAALAELSVARLEMDVLDVDFEISKRQDFTDDPDLPKLVERKKGLEGQLAQARTATRPAPGK